MSRTLRFSLVLLILLGLLLSIGAADANADTQGTAIVTASALNLRSEPSTDSSSLACVSYGTTVTVTGSTDGWYAVDCNGTSGYMCADYLSFTAADTSSSSDSSSASSTDASAVTASGGTGTVTGSGVNVRSGPDTSYSAVGSLSNGATVTITGTSGSWYQIDYNGQTAYIIGTYVSTGSSSDTSSSTTPDTTPEATPAAATTDSIQADTSVTGTGTVTGNQVNIRSGPDTSYSALGSVNKGDTLTVTGQSGSWYQVSYNSGTAYIISTYLSLGGSSGSSASSSSSTGGSSSVDTSVSGTGTINGSDVRLRASTSTTSTILDVLDKNTTVSVTGKADDWYAVTYNGLSGYVYGVYVTMGSAGTTTSSGTSTDETVSVTAYTAYVTSPVNMRTGADTSYTSLHVLSAGTAVTVIGTSGSWDQVQYNNETGYIYSTYLSTTAPSSGSSGSSGSSVSNAIVNEAKNYIGVPYVYGGTSPSGFDCSGFVYYVFRQCGYTITRTATAQSYLGSAVSRSDLQPGDIIIFYNSAMTGIGHSGIYIGNNQFIHASSGGGRVMISSLSESYYNSHYYCARRVA